MSKEFENLIRECCAVEASLRETSVDTRLSADAIITQCLQYGMTSLARVDNLRQALLDHPDRLRNTSAFIRQAEKLIESGRMAAGAPKDIVRMASCPARDEARAELAEFNHNLHTAWAIAVQNTHRRYPESFGKRQDLLGYTGKVENLRAKRADLFEKIPRAFQQDDLLIGDLDRNGRARISLKIAPEVNLLPLESLAERLVDHLLAVDPNRWIDKAGGTRAQAKEKEEKIKNARIAG